MNNKRLEIIIIILSVEMLLLLYSLFSSEKYHSNLTDNLRFMSTDKLLDFHQNDPNVVADSLLIRYLSDTSSADTLFYRNSLSEIGPRKKNIFLTNTEINGITPLDNFFNALMSEKDTTVIRIAHYGDSQLEGDRMSCLVRKKFHEKFGGSGQGYVPLKDLAPISYTRISSGNWARYTVFHDKYSNNFYGLSGLVFHFSRYAVFQPEENSHDSIPVVKDTQKVACQNNYYCNASLTVKMSEDLLYNNVSVMYGRTNEHTILNYYNSKTGEKFASDTLNPSEKVTLHKRYFQNPPLTLKLEFSSPQSPDFYGVYLDGQNGVQVDNYAIRGHSGDGLMLIENDHLARMIKLLNTKLIVFQYGANIVPYIKSDKACEWLSGVYYDMFMKFRQAAPDISILVIGPGDMARCGEGGCSSYLWLPKINEAFKKAALKAGCAYWDLFNMMGGRNSIMAWSAKKLAVSNGHFSASGQEIIANELVEALMIEYNIYLHKIRKNKYHA